MKRALTLTAAVLLALALTSCDSAQVDLSVYPWELEECTETFENLDENLSMYFAENSLTATGCTVIVENNTDADFQFGESYSVHIYLNGKWYSLPGRSWHVELVTAEAHNSYTQAVDWSDYLGELPAGHYRMVKDDHFYKTYCMVYEFDIS